MMTIFALYLWTVVGVGYDHGTRATGYDWRYAGEFATKQHCEEAARQLGIKTDVYRCVDTGRKS